MGNMTAKGAKAAANKSAEKADNWGECAKEIIESQPLVKFADEVNSLDFIETVEIDDGSGSGFGGGQRGGRFDNRRNDYQRDDYNNKRPAYNDGNQSGSYGQDRRDDRRNDRFDDRRGQRDSYDRPPRDSYQDRPPRDSYDRPPRDSYQDRPPR